MLLFSCFLTQGWCDLRAEEFDGAEEIGLRRFGHIHLERDSRDAAQGFTVAQNFFRNFFGVAHQQRAVLAPPGVELSTGDGRPAAFLADASNGLGVTAEKIIDRLLRGFGDVTQGMNADSKLVGRMSRTPATFAIDVNERAKSPRLAANDRDHQRQSERPGAGERFRRSADAEPDGQGILQRARINALTGERRPVFAGPMNEFGFTGDVTPAGEKFCEILRKISNEANAAKPRPARS